MKLLGVVNDYQIFDLTKNENEFIENKSTAKKNRHHESNRKNNQDSAQEIDLISDFSMPTACSQVKLTKDNNYTFISGTYGPQIKCYEFSQISEKFTRGIKSQSKKFDIISNDCSKFCVLDEKNFLEFHTGRQMYHSVKLSNLARDMNISEEYAEIYFPSRGGVINRINLEIGRFLKPFESKDHDFRCGDINPFHSLYACGSDRGEVVFFDPRTQSSTGKLSINSPKLPKNSLPTTMKYKGPFIFGIGLSSGHILIYDLRSSKEMMIKDHLYRFPIQDIQFINTESIKNAVMSSDKKSIKFWSEVDSKPITSIESKESINNTVILPNSGLIFAACQSPNMHTYFIPGIGPAPSWCSYLDDVINDIENNPKPLDEFDDKKFVTIEDLKSLHLKHLLGTGNLKAYMHGYLISQDIYRKAVDQKSDLEKNENIATLEGFYLSKAENYIKKLTSSKINVQDESALPSVNKSLFNKINSSNKNGTILKDDRFASLFKDKEFEIDQNDEDFILNTIVSKSHDGNHDSSDDDENIKNYRKEIRQNLHKIRNKDHIAQIKEDKEAVLELTSTNQYKDKSSNKKSNKKIKLLTANENMNQQTLGNQLELNNTKDNSKRVPKNSNKQTMSKKNKIIKEHMNERKLSMRKTAQNKKRKM